MQIQMRNKLSSVSSSKQIHGPKLYNHFHSTYAIGVGRCRCRCTSVHVAWLWQCAIALGLRVRQNSSVTQTTFACNNHYSWCPWHSVGPLPLPLPLMPLDAPNNVVPTNGLTDISYAPRLFHPIVSK